ncbi:MAG: YtxH domain-containing protein [Sphingobacteriales bacterium]|nr:YtxH domain-containing protein [Bacteroidota bacterium]MBI3720448.1 YtxH domain-containing protein [Sphingobacteriales bacterium]
MNNNAKILTALGAGLAAGAILGVLFAPDKGTETRKKINQQGQKLADAVKDKFNKGKEKLNGLKEELNEKMSMTEENF